MQLVYKKTLKKKKKKIIILKIPLSFNYLKINYYSKKKKK